MEQPKIAEPAGKRSIRSPKYPGLTFTDALERIRIIYKEDRRSPATAQVVLRHLGLTAGSGPANRILSALKQYGLLDDLAGHGHADRAFGTADAAGQFGLGQIEGFALAPHPVAERRIAIHGCLFSCRVDAIRDGDAVAHLVRFLVRLL